MAQNSFTPVRAHNLLFWILVIVLRLMRVVVRSHHSKRGIIYYYQQKKQNSRDLMTQLNIKILEREIELFMYLLRSN